MEVRLSQSWESHTADTSGSFIPLPLDGSIEGSEEAAVQEEDDSSEEKEEGGEEEWIVQRSSRHRGQRKGASVSLSRLGAPPTPRAGRAGKPYVEVCASP